MPQRLALLDTDILSELLKKHPLVTERIRRYLAEHNAVVALPCWSVTPPFLALAGTDARRGLDVAL